MPTGRAQDYFENAISELKKITPPVPTREEDIAIKNVQWCLSALKVECDELQQIILYYEDQED